MTAPDATLDLAHRRLDLATDLDLLHGWVTHPRAAFWMMQGATREQVRKEYDAILASGHHRADVGLHHGTPAFLFERYDPQRDPVGAHLDARPGDLGMHVLVGPARTPVHGFTRAVMRHVMAACFADPDVRRVVVEPDARNERVRRLNLEVGFTEHREVDLPDKRAVLSTCTRHDHDLASTRSTP